MANERLWQASFNNVLLILGRALLIARLDSSQASEPPKCRSAIDPTTGLLLPSPVCELWLCGWSLGVNRIFFFSAFSAGLVCPPCSKEKASGKGLHRWGQKRVGQGHMHSNACATERNIHWIDQQMIFICYGKLPCRSCGKLPCRSSICCDNSRDFLAVQ